MAKITLTMYSNAFRQGLDDAIRKQVLNFFSVLMSEELTEDTIERFENGVEKALAIQSIMDKTFTKHGLEEMEEDLLDLRRKREERN